jgi:hypothetical protein
MVVMAVTMAVVVSMIAVRVGRMVMVIMMVVVVVLAHASVPVEGSAICSSISLRTPLIWASAAE